MDLLPLCDPTKERRVVVCVTNVGVAAVESRDRVEQQLPRCEKAGRPLRIAIEVPRPETRFPRIIEVVAPSELCDELPERAQEIAFRIDVDMSGPHRCALE